MKNKSEQGTGNVDQWEWELLYFIWEVGLSSLKRQHLSRDLRQGEHSISGRRNGSKGLQKKIMVLKE